MGTRLILPDLVLPSRRNQRWKYSGLDSPNQCLDKNHFASYPYTVEYAYNSRGFRDAEWPEDIIDLSSAIWCVGDSFTVGLGQPYHHIWPQVLQTRALTRTINVSMDGASNDWIARKALRVIDEINPKNIVILWSYTHRIELSDDNLSDEDRRCHYSKLSSQQDLQHWISLTNKIKNSKANAIQVTIPGFHNTDKQINLIEMIKKNWEDVKDPTWPDHPNKLQELENLPTHIKHELKFVHRCYDLFKWILSPQMPVSEITANTPIVLPNDVIHIRNQLDQARDYHHFDILTAQWMVDRILERMGVEDSSRIDSPVVSDHRSHQT
jgi:hypothetical protein